MESPSKPSVQSPSTSQLSAQPDDLRALLDGIADRNQRAMAMFYDATINRVYGLIQNIIYDESLVGEVISDVYFQVWNRAGDYDESRGSIIGWLLMQARTRAIDLLRKHRRHATVTGDDQEVAAPDHLNADQIVLALEQGHAIQKALAQLNPIQRQLITLAFYRDMSHSELAEHMQIPLGTVKSHLRRALIALKKHLGEGADVLLQ